MSPSDLPTAWQGLVDDAAIFPPGNAALPDAVEAHRSRHHDWYAGLVGPFVVSDIRLPDLLDILDDRDEDEPLPVTVVVTGGAGSVRPAVKWSTGSGQLRLAGLETALRDLDDLAGNARRVVAAVDEAHGDGVLDEDCPVYLELPNLGSMTSWEAAADVAAERELRLKFRTGGAHPDQFPTAHALASWIDAALDRELPFKCTAGLHHAVRHTVSEGFEAPVDQHGFLNVLLATRRLFDGTSLDEAAELLDERDTGRLVELAGAEDLAGARRWFTSFGSCSVDEPLEDLIDLGLLEVPR